jgi:UDP-N-acetylglucosamine diphosphorylase / glucose-1-phosphate thymidylyltransferase / UDP-N-acetylgalactosamine diphosphorylase / glucosamine-1-phosphate N-acetyltransferase / galactosamine-1-phosphate N-acetyltransferase
MKAVLLAAGVGNRLFPITESLPKPMIKIAGKPILEYILEDLIAVGFDDFCIVMGYQSKQIKKYFEFWRKNSIHMTFVTQENLIGTANAIYCAKDFVKNENFLVYLSDTIISSDLQNILSKIISDTSTISLISSNVYSNASNSVGNVVTKDDLVTSLSEKLNDVSSNLAWAGLAFFKNSFIFEIIEKLNISQRGEYDITDAMNFAIQKNKQIKNYICKEFIDCGTTRGLLDGLKYILSKNSQFYEKNSSHSQNLVYMGKNCLIGKNTKIGPNVSLGDDVFVGNDVVITNSLIMDNTTIESNTQISNSIICGKNNLTLHDALQE